MWGGGKVQGGDKVRGGGKVRGHGWLSSLQAKGSDVHGLWRTFSLYRQAAARSTPLLDWEYVYASCV